MATVVISASSSGVSVCVWGRGECLSVGAGRVGSLPWPDTAADAGGFTLLSNPPLWCSREWVPGRELMLSPLPRRGSRFFGRAEGRISPFWEKSRPFWASTECRKPPATALELLALGLISFVLLGVATGDGVKGTAVGTSLSEKSRKQRMNDFNWQDEWIKKEESLKMPWEYVCGWFCYCPASLIGSAVF